MRYDYFLCCMSGWRAILCVFDNLMPHHEVRGLPDETWMEAWFPFSLVCRLHDWAGNTSSRPDVED